MAAAPLPQMQQSGKTPRLPSTLRRIVKFEVIYQRPNLIPAPPRPEGQSCPTWTDIQLCHIKESIASISENDPNCSNGTGFRVGDKYLMTAYHVMVTKIDMMVDCICYFVEEQRDERKLFTALGYSEVGKNDMSPKKMRSYLIDFLKNNFTDVELLFRRLKENRVDTDNIRQWLDSQWNCKAFFVGQNPYSLDYGIVFGDESIDIVILKINSEDIGPGFPRPFSLDNKFSKERDFVIATYDHVAGDGVIINKPRVFKSDDDLRKLQDEAVIWCKKMDPKKHNFYREAYQNPKSVFNEATGRVVLQCSDQFRKGASGSPVMYINRLVVSLIYQRGYPEFHYEDTSNEYVKITNSKYLYQSGTAMERLATILKYETRRELHNDLFY